MVKEDWFCFVFKLQAPKDLYAHRVGGGWHLPEQGPAKVTWGGGPGPGAGSSTAPTGRQHPGQRQATQQR